MKCVHRSASSGYFAAVLVGWLSIAASVTFGNTPSGKLPESAPGQNARAVLIGLPLSFEANRGQTDPSVKFLSRGDGYALFLTADSAVFKLRASGDKSPAVVRMKLAGANAGAKLSGGETLSGTVNYFIGNDPSKWTNNVGTFGRVNYQQIYPGIDLVYYGTQRQLEYDFIVTPGADPKQIGLEFEGAKPTLGPDGSLQLTLDGAPLTFRKPVVYQTIAGKKNMIAGHYKLSGGRVHFALGNYDHKRALVIDPVLTYLTYLGGSNFDSIGFESYYGGSNATNPTQGIAVDSSGNVYVAGYTQSTDFPVQNALQATSTTQAQTGFIAKLNAAGSQLIYSTYIGGDVLHGNSTTRPYAIAVDGSGNAYVTGLTSSPYFPVTAGAYQAVCGYATTSGNSCPNTQSAFLTKLSSSGSLVYSTYLGHLNETGVAVAVDSQGRAYVAGNSAANCTTAVPSCFPTTANAVLQGSVFNNTVHPTNQQVGSAFISVFDAAGANLLYSSLYGYSDITTTNHGATYGVGVAVDASGNFYLAGDTQNDGLPVTAGAFQHYIGNTNPSLASNSRGFVAKFNPVSSGAGLAYATYLGGTDPAQGAYSDGIGGIAADAAGNAYVSGNASYNFPVTAGAYDTNPCPFTLCQNRGFLAKINPAGSALVWATFIGGTRPDLSAVSSISAPRLDANGNVYVSGAAGNNTQVPLVNPLQPANGFGGVFVTKFDPTGSTVLFSTVIYDPTANGGLFSSGVDVDTQGNVYVAGNANVGGLPATVGAFQHTIVGPAADGFIAKLNLLLSPTIGLVVAPATANAGSPVTFTATVTGVAGHPTPTGTVNFMLGSTTLGSGTLNASGVASFISSAINGGNYSVTAVYAGDNIYSALTSAASALTITGSLPCNYFFSSNGQAFPAAGGVGNIAITVAAGCPWTVGALPPFATLTSSGSGSGNGTVTFTVALNSGGDRSGPFTINGQTFTIEQEASSITGLNLIGSMPHIAAEENWTTMFTMVNNTGSSNQVRFSLFGSNLDASGGGNPLQLPLNLPQQASLGVLLGASLDNTLSPNASWIVSTGGQGIAPVQTGSAQVSATGALGGFAIFHRFSDAQEAVVPLTAGTPNAPSYLLAFDNANGIVTSVAVANVSSQTANIGYIIRDDTGTQIGSGTLTALPGHGQIAFVLPDAATGFPVTANKRGTVEFDTPAGGQISVLGIRNTPQATALGTVTTLTTVPALANVGTGGGSFAFIASGGDGWQTTFVLVNAGNSTAPASLKFFDPNGNPQSLPLSFPQTGVVNQASSINPTLAAGATLLVQSSGAATLLTGSAQLTTPGNVSGFVIFRHNGQEAVVPIESRNASAYVLAFDNTGGTATGLAVNAVTSSTQAVNVPVVIRDDSGNQLATDSLPLAANGDFAGDLAQNSATLGRILLPATANIRGTVEFDAPAGVHIGVIGIRTPPTPTPTYTSLPALAR